jgi:hypothetical protein
VEVIAVVKCPFCGFSNEEGALFCEQCKSDISNVAPTTGTPPSGSPPTPMPETIAPAEVIPMVEVEEAPVMAAIVEEEVPVVEVVEETPVAALVEETPVPADPAEMPVAPPLPFMPAGEAAQADPNAVETAPPVEVPAAVPAPASTPVRPAASAGTPIAPGAAVKLVVQRGLKIGEEFSVFAGENYVGRADEKPVDVDLTFQEPEDRVWCSRQHALIVYDDATGMLTVEDLNSVNGTFVNRERVYPGQPRQLFAGNTIQIGTVHMKVKV